MDFTDIMAYLTTGTATIIAGLTAAAVLKFGPTLTKWGYNKVIGWFGR